MKDKDLAASHTNHTPTSPLPRWGPFPPSPPSLLYLEGSLPTPQCHDYRHSPPRPPTPLLEGRAAAPGWEVLMVFPKKGKTPPTFSETASAVIPAQPGSLRTPRSGRASASILITLSKMKNRNRLFFPPSARPPSFSPAPSLQISKCAG